MQLQGGEFWIGMGYTLMWLAILLGSGIPVIFLWYYARRRNPERFGVPRSSESGPGTAGRERVIDPDMWVAMRQRARAQASRPDPIAAPPPPPALPPPAPAAPPLPLPPAPLRMTSAERRHTIIIGAPGDGKTQTQLALMIGDIRRGDQVIWASTNLALYHARDQRTDLRPIAHLFEHTREPLAIMAVLRWAAAEVDRRMPRYHANQPHGDPIVIYVDELGGLYRQFGETLVNAMRNIAEQGRKVDMYLVLVAHNALKDATGLDMALKPLFQTRLLGNVDQATWTAMVGPGIKLRSVPDGRGLWHMPDRRNQIHEVHIALPTATAIAALATQAQPSHSRRSILERAHEYIAQIRAAQGEPARPVPVRAVAPTPPNRPESPPLVPDSVPVRSQDNADTPDTNAVRAGSAPVSGDAAVAAPEPPAVPPSRDDTVRFLALQRTPDDSGWRYSANKIADLVGGTRTTILEQIRTLRGAGQGGAAASEARS